MPNTNIKEKEKDIQRLLNKDLSRVKETTPYGKMLDKLNTLVKQTDYMYAKDSEGREKPMESQAYEKLLTNYQELQNACEDCLKTGAAKTNLEKNRLFVVKRLQNYINKDMHYLEGLNKERLPSLSDAVRGARTVRVNLPDVPLDKVGAVQNVRIAMKSANGVKGFFTEKSGFDFNQELLEVFHKEIPKEQRNSFQGIMKSDKSRKKFLEHALAIETYPGLSKTEKEYYVMNLAQAACGRKYLPPKETADALLKLAEKSYPVANKQKNLADAEIVNKKRLDQRNCAMSRMAELLGCSKVIAKSVPMSVSIKGKTVEGTFMEKAEGLDINRMSQEQKKLTYDPKDMVTPEALKQLSELDVLDLVCGNIDRHVGNMLYQFQNINGRQKLTGITGIDNDTSFGKVQANSGTRHQTPIQGIKVISAEQAQHLLLLNQNIIKTALADFELDEKEVEAVWNRTKALQDKIKEKKIEIVPKEQWKNKTLENCNGLNNIFHDISTLPDEIKKTPPLENNQTLHFADGKRAEDFRLTDLKEQQKNFLSFAERMRKADDNYYINSSKFNSMRNATYRLETFYKDLQQKYPTGDKQISAEDMKKLQELNNKMLETSQAYIDDKKITPKTDHGKLRLSLAHDLHDLSATVRDMVIPEKDAPVLEEPEMEAPELKEPANEFSM